MDNQMIVIPSEGTPMTEVVNGLIGISATLAQIAQEVDNTGEVSEPVKEDLKLLSQSLLTILERYDNNS